MGIQGLLPLLKDIQSKTHISSFRGQTVGIDTYCWLHKGTYGCAKDLILGKYNPAYVAYVMKRVKMLISYGVTPILVFDGGHLPAKAEKERERRERRKDYKTKGLAALREGKSQEAFEHFQKACDVTPKMANDVIVECESLNVQCIVAPYEADAQLAYLMMEGITQLTISEDSDLLLYGCTRVLYKMTADGEGLLVDISNLNRVRTVQLSSFTFDKFRQMCMLSGCDYLPSVKGMGLKKAHNALKKHADAYKCIRFLKCDRVFTVPKGYEENFRKAEIVFKYQLVFDPRKKKLVRLNSIEDGTEFQPDDLDYAGPNIDDRKALDIALGNVDPIKGERFAGRTDFTLPTKGKSTETAFQHGKKKTVLSQSTPTLPHESESVAPAGSTSDLTPTSRDALVTDKPLVKSLFNSRTEAAKSLEILQSEETEELQPDRLRDLYTEKNITSYHHVIPETKPENRQNIFTIKKNRHKFRNPFRKHEYQDSSKEQVFSRYFTGQNNSEGSPAIVNETQEREKSPLKEPLTFSENREQPSKDGPTKINSSFIDYLDTNDVSMSSLPRKRLTLSSDPVPTKRHRKSSSSELDIKAMLKEKKRLEVIKLEEKETTNNVTKKRNPLSPLSPNIPESNEKIDFSITQSATDEVVISPDGKTEIFIISPETENIENELLQMEDKVKIKSKINKDITENQSDEVTICNSGKSANNTEEKPEVIVLSPKKEYFGDKILQFQNKGKIKLGLSRNNSREKNSNSQISENLNKFYPSIALEKRDNSISVNVEDGSVKSKKTAEMLYFDEEEVLPKLPKLPSIDLEECKSKEPANHNVDRAKFDKCRPIGLSRKHKTSLLKQNGNAKQLTLDKFQFQRKGLTLW